jgi:uncharacterized membrane protein YdjX (TVP38/TMEM64 family)
MEKAYKIKLFIAIFYLILVGLFLYFFFSKFTLEEITSYEFLKNNRDYFFLLKQSNLFLLAIIFIFSIIIWVLAAGFGSPVAIVSGFIFGKWVGLLVAVIGLSFGATLLYLLANFFFKDFIKEKFLTKFEDLETKFKKSEFIYLLIYRFIGGIPFALSNVLPCIFNVKLANFFWATFLGIMPQLFLICSIGSGLEKIIDQNFEAPSMISLITSKDIYIPLLLFLFLVLVTVFLRKIFYKK